MDNIYIARDLYLYQPNPNPIDVLVYSYLLSKAGLGYGVISVS